MARRSRITSDFRLGNSAPLLKLFLHIFNSCYMRLDDAVGTRGAAEDMDEEWKIDSGVGTDLGTRHCVVSDNILCLAALSEAAATMFPR